MRAMMAAAGLAVETLVDDELGYLLKARLPAPDGGLSARRHHS